MVSAFAFTALSFVLAWALWTTASTLDPAYRGWLFLLGTITPSIVALLLTARESGRTGLDRMLSSLFAWRVDFRLYAFAIFYMAAILLTAAIAHRLIAGAWPTFGNENLVLIALVIPLSTPVQAGEEIGWRGYLLPRLAPRLGLGPASLVVGVIWASWHLPMFFLTGADMIGRSFWVFLLSVTAISVAMTWLYARSKGSLLLVMLMHAAINNTSGVVVRHVPGSAPDVFGLHASLMAWLTALLMVICAVYLLLRMPDARSIEAR